MGLRIIFLIILSTFFVNNKIQAQSDTLSYKVGLGVSALSFWDHGNLAYRERLKRNFASDVILSGNLFINNFTLDLKVQSSNKFGRISYLFANDAKGTVSLRSLILTYGLNKSYFDRILELNSEIGLGYSLLIDSKEFSIENEANGVVGIGFDVKIWKGLYLDNRLRGVISFVNKKLYVSHTISIGYKF